MVDIRFSLLQCVVLWRENGQLGCDMRTGPANWIDILDRERQDGLRSFERMEVALHFTGGDSNFAPKIPRDCFCKSETAISAGRGVASHVPPVQRLILNSSRQHAGRVRVFGGLDSPDVLFRMKFSSNKPSDSCHNVRGSISFVFVVTGLPCKHHCALVCPVATDFRFPVVAFRWVPTIRSGFSLAYYLITCA